MFDLDCYGVTARMLRSSKASTFSWCPVERMEQLAQEVLSMLGGDPRSRNLWNLSGFSGFSSSHRSRTASALGFGFNDFFRPIIDPTFWALCRLLSGKRCQSWWGYWSLQNHIEVTRVRSHSFETQTGFSFVVVYPFPFYLWCLFYYNMERESPQLPLSGQRRSVASLNQGVLWPPSRDVVPSGLVYIAVC